MLQIQRVFSPQIRNREPFATGWWRRECPLKFGIYLAISICYEFASGRTHRSTRNLMQDFSGPGRTLVNSSGHALRIPAG